MVDRAPSEDFDARVAELEAELDATRERLAESEETIRAIRGGEVDAFVVQLKQGERVYALRGSEHAYLTFVEQMRDGAVTVSEDGTVLYANRRFLDMLGLPRSRVVGVNLLDHVAPEDGYMSEALLRRGGERESIGEVSFVGRNGNRVSTNLYAFPVDLEGIRTVSVLVTDLTEINRYRYDLEQMVQSRTEELVEVNEELKRLSEAKNELIARLAAELEKPVRDVEEVVGGLAPAASRLAEDEQVPLARRGLVLIENSLIRLNALLQDVTMLAEIESGNARLEFGTVNLRALAMDAAEQARGPSREKGIEIQVSVPEEDVSFLADARKIRQILVALLLVCAESLEVGPVRLNANVASELQARFSVCASGHGLPMEDIRSILEGEPDSETLRRVSARVPAMSIWTARRMAQFLNGELSVVHGEAEDCFVLTLPM